MVGFKFSFTALALLSSAAWAQNKEVSCNSARDGVEHIAKVFLLNNQIEGFSYSSAAKNGHTCEVGTTRKDAESKWANENKNKFIVSLSLLDTEDVQVAIQESEATYTIDYYLIPVHCVA